ncbi:MAG: Uma2 family endonuclease [Gemmatimonadaceae bacterium]
MPAQATIWTPDLVRVLPDDGNRYEVVDGELLVTPAPSPAHQRVFRELLVAISSYVERHGLGQTLSSPADISFDDRSLVQPDLFVVPQDVSPTFAQWSDLTSLLLAVEILSPTTARADRTVKRRLYQCWPVEEYWIVDGDARLIERWRRGDERPQLADGELTWQPNAATSPLRLDLEKLFSAALG